VDRDTQVRGESRAIVPEERPGDGGGVDLARRTLGLVTEGVGAGRAQVAMVSVGFEPDAEAASAITDGARPDARLVAAFQQHPNAAFLPAGRRGRFGDEDEIGGHDLPHAARGGLEFWNAP